MLKIAVCKNFFPLQTANVSYFQRKMQLSGFCAHPDSSRSQLTQLIAVMLHLFSYNSLLNPNSH
jgi:hypothetical protein